MLGMPFLFIGGVVFGYLIVVPRAIGFLQNFNTDAFDVLIQAQPYYKFVLMLLIAMGLLFQIPVAIIAVTRVGIVSTSSSRTTGATRFSSSPSSPCSCPARTRSRCR